MCENVRKISECSLILQKWHPKSKWRRFFSEVIILISCFWASLGEIWEKIMLAVCFDFKKCKNWKDCSRSFFEVIFFGVFSGKFRKIRAKIFHTPKNLPAHTPMLQNIPNKVVHFYILTEFFSDWTSKADFTTLRWFMTVLPYANVVQLQAHGHSGKTFKSETCEKTCEVAFVFQKCLRWIKCIFTRTMNRLRPFLCTIVVFVYFAIKLKYGPLLTLRWTTCVDNLCFLVPRRSLSWRVHWACRAFFAFSE